MCDSNDSKYFGLYSFLAQDCQQRIISLPAPPQMHAVRHTQIFTGYTPHKCPACKHSKHFASAHHSWFQWRNNRQIDISLSHFSNYNFSWLLGGIQLCNKEQAFPMFFRHKPCIRVLNVTKTEPVPRAGLLQTDNAQLVNPHWIYRTYHASPQ